MHSDAGHCELELASNKQLALFRRGSFLFAQEVYVGPVFLAGRDRQKCEDQEFGEPELENLVSQHTSKKFKARYDCI